MYISVTSVFYTKKCLFNIFQNLDPKREHLAAYALMSEEKSFFDFKWINNQRTSFEDYFSESANFLSLLCNRLKQAKTSNDNIAGDGRVYDHN